MFIIKVRESTWVAGVNRQHQIVSMSRIPAAAKMFKTKKAAASFIQRYADTGYGISTNATVEQFQSQ